MKNTKAKQADKSDVSDSERDEKYLEREEFTVDLPDVEDIPGQENVRPPKMRETQDVTASSADEEGIGLFKDEDDVTNEEKELLEKSSESMASEEDMEIENIRLDNVDNDGVKLNERQDFAGEDLDVPGSDLDDENEDIGEEDEENNSYSWAQ